MSAIKLCTKFEQKFMGFNKVNKKLQQEGSEEEIFYKHLDSLQNRLWFKKQTVGKGVG
jgi:hypothetical protein